MKENWIEAKLDDLCIIILGQSPPSSSYNFDRNGIPFFQGKAEFTSRYPKIIKWCSAPKKTAKINDILLSVRAPVGATNIANINCAIGRGLAAIRYSQCNLYIYYYLKLIEKKLDDKGTGSTFKAISGSIIKEQEIDLPPLPEQRAIVAKIEQLFSELDNGIDNLKKAQEQLKVYRQAVLKKAYEGELTKEWREKQTDLPTADELLEQIKTERDAYYKKQLDEWQQKVKEWEADGKKGKKPSKPKLNKELLNFSNDELSEIPKLPKEWSWIKVDKLSEYNLNSIKAGPFGSSLKKSFYVKNGYKIYGQEQVISGNYRYGDYYINHEKYVELISCKVKPNDILISLVGTVGKVLILPQDCEDGIINPRLIKISPNNYYLSIFFKYYFESTFIKSLYKNKNHGTTMDVLNLGIIQELPFPLCSLQEQTQIVQEIESRLSVCDKLEETIKESLEKSEALRQSILKKAFEGKLLTVQELEACQKEPDWEPAEQLLKRIKSEKDKLINNKRDTK